MVMSNSLGFSRSSLAMSPESPFLSFNSFSWSDVREKNAASQAEKKAEKTRSTVIWRVCGNIDSSKVSVDSQCDRRIWIEIIKNFLVGRFQFKEQGRLHYLYLKWLNPIAGLRKILLPFALVRMIFFGELVISPICEIKVLAFKNNLFRFLTSSGFIVNSNS